MRPSRSLWILTAAAVASAAAIPHIAGSRGGQPPGPVTFTRVDLGGPTRDRASTGGASIVDIDGDGDLDLFVTNGYDVSHRPPEPQNDRLYLNDGEGGFVTVEGSPLSTEQDFGSGHTWGDYDADGDVDVFVAQQRGRDNLLYRNEGEGRFTRVLDGPVVRDGGISYAAAWADFDRDGHLDLAVANGGLSAVATNFLYRNRGDGSFEAVTDDPVVTDSAAHAGLAWGDYDDDGDPDLFIARNHSPATLTSALYRNDGAGRFAAVIDVPPVTDTMPALGAAWGDYDNDGDLDLHVATRSGWSNRLYRNDGDGRFTRVLTGGPHVLDGSYSSGTAWIDYDNDGDLDLFSSGWGAPSFLYTNLGDGRFERREHGDLGRDATHVGASAWGDVDGDGDLDLYAGNWPNWPGAHENNHYYRNDAPGRAWLVVRLVGTVSNRSAIGARVTARARIDGRPVTQTRELFPGSGFRGLGPMTVHLGFGDAGRVEELTVRWPSGRVQRVRGVETRQHLTLTEPGEP